MNRKALLFALLPFFTLSVGAQADTLAEAPSHRVADASTTPPAIPNDVDETPLARPIPAAPSDADPPQSPLWPSLAVLGIMVILRVRLREHWAETRDAIR